MTMYDLRKLEYGGRDVDVSVDNEKATDKITDCIKHGIRQIVIGLRKWCKRVDTGNDFIAVSDA